MGRVSTSIDSTTAEWIANQHLFFVATAPSDAGHVNVSPKGLDTFTIVDDTTVAYLDLTGSGSETIAHVRQNQRITVMFCAFDGPPRIVRLYGAGRVVLPHDDRFDEIAARFPMRRAVRSAILVSVDRVQDSCGYSVPKMDFVENRTRLDTWAMNRTEDDITTYWAEKNSKSIDGLPALDT